jgi:hypothetical protein
LVIASAAKQSFWREINRLEIAASLALLAMTSNDVWTWKGGYLFSG